MKLCGGKRRGSRSFRGELSLGDVRWRLVRSAMTAGRLSARLSGAFPPRFTTGTVRSAPKASGEVVGSAGSPGCPGCAPDGYVRGLV